MNQRVKVKDSKTHETYLETTLENLKTTTEAGFMRVLVRIAERGLERADREDCCFVATESRSGYYLEMEY